MLAAVSSSIHQRDNIESERKRMIEETVAVDGNQDETQTRHDPPRFACLAQLCLKMCTHTVLEIMGNRNNNNNNIRWGRHNVATMFSTCFLLSI